MNRELRCIPFSVTSGRSRIWWGSRWSDVAPACPCFCFDFVFSGFVATGFVFSGVVSAGVVSAGVVSAGVVSAIVPSLFSPSLSSEASAGTPAMRGRPSVYLFFFLGHFFLDRVEGSLGHKHLFGPENLKGIEVAHGRHADFVNVSCAFVDVIV